jgi:hypothetical protein
MGTAQPAIPPAKTLLTKKDVDLSFSLYLISGAARLLSALTCCVPHACKSADEADGPGVVIERSAADSITGAAVAGSLAGGTRAGVARSLRPRTCSNKDLQSRPEEGQKKLGGVRWGRCGPRSRI